MAGYGFASNPPYGLDRAERGKTGTGAESTFGRSNFRIVHERSDRKVHSIARESRKYTMANK
jgi:hypothetical protein